MSRVVEVVLVELVANMVRFETWFAEMKNGKAVPPAPEGWMPSQHCPLFQTL
jgi:hypothetical protein